MTANQSDITDVIFKVFPEGDVIAFFPGLAATSKSWQCLSYQHVGQHGPADVSLISKMKKATPEQYADLLDELEGQGYTLRVVLRATRAHMRLRRQQID